MPYTTSGRPARKRDDVANLAQNAAGAPRNTSIQRGYRSVKFADGYIDTPDSILRPVKQARTSKPRVAKEQRERAPKTVQRTYVPKHVDRPAPLTVKSTGVTIKMSEF